jgi:hypothetical protein
MFSKTRQQLPSALVAIAFVTLLAAAPAQAASPFLSLTVAPDPPSGSTGTGGTPSNSGSGGDAGGMIDPNG